MKHLFFILIIVILFVNKSKSQKDKHLNKLQMQGHSNIQIEDAPFIVGLNISKFAHKHFGVAVIINEKWLLSTASFFAYPTEKIYAENNDFFLVDDRKYYIRTGFTKIDDPDANFIEIEKVVIPDKYRYDQSIKNDIALIKLKEPLNFSKKISPIKILEPANDNLIEKDDSLDIFGYSLSWNSNIDELRLTHLSMPKLSLNKANNWVKEEYSNQYRVNLFSVDDIIIGSKAGYYGFCEFDDGSPLVVNDENGNIFLAGLYSWTAHCQGYKSPNAFVNVSKHTDWINNTISRYDINEATDNVNPVDLITSRLYKSCDESSSFNLKSVFAINDTNKVESFKYNLEINSSNVTKTFSEVVKMDSLNEKGKYITILRPIYLENSYDSIDIKSFISKVNNNFIENSKSFSKSFQKRNTNKFRLEYQLANSSSSNNELKIELINERGLYKIYDLKGDSTKQVIEGCLQFGNNQFKSAQGTKLFFVDGIITLYIYNEKQNRWYKIFEKTGQSGTNLNEHVNIPFKPRTDLTLNFKNNIDGCSMLERSYLRNILISNNSNYLIDKSKINIEFNDDKQEPIIANLKNGTFDSLFRFEILRGYNSLLIDLETVDPNELDINNFNNVINEHYYVETDTYKNISFKNQSQMLVKLNLLNKETLQELKFDLYPSENKEVEICVPYGCYEAEIIIYQEGENNNYKEQVITISDNNNYILNQIYFENFEVFKPNNFDICIDFPGNVENEFDEIIEIKNGYLSSDIPLMQISIFDLNGSLIDTKQNVKHYKIDNLNLGIYFYQIKTNNGIYRDKFLKY